jgi:glycosyltransferase involved in cell wall biosynthesis
MMKNHVKVSVLMTVYNTPFQLIQRAVASVFRQDEQDFELIMMDDGSDIELSKSLLQCCQVYNAKMIYVRHANQGQSEAVNRAIPICRGAYIAMLDADDEYKENHLSTCLAAIQGADLVSSLTETVVNEEADYYIPDIIDPLKNIHVDNCIPFATLFGKKVVFETIPFQKTYGADRHFYEQAAQQFRVKKLPTRTYVYYRNHTHSITAKLKVLQTQKPL